MLVRIIPIKYGKFNENEGKELFHLAELERQEFQQRKMLFASRETLIILRYV